MALVVPPGQPQEYARVIKTEEKGSDVNLATHLLHDAHIGRFDVAVVISNDSDLLEPIKIVREQLHKRVGILNPHRNPSRSPLKAPGRITARRGARTSKPRSVSLSSVRSAFASAFASAIRASTPARASAPIILLACSTPLSPSRVTRR